MIPGLAMFTARAEPLATWMTGLEIAYFKVRRQHVHVLSSLVSCFTFCSPAPPGNPAMLSIYLSPTHGSREQHCRSRVLSQDCAVRF